jgi:hypothetical protein
LQIKKWDSKRKKKNKKNLYVSSVSLGAGIAQNSDGLWAALPEFGFRQGKEIFLFL